MEGKLEIPQLKAALQLIVRRHEVFRTMFVRQTGMKIPFQVISLDHPLPWEQVNAGRMRETAPGGEVEDYWKKAGQTSWAWEHAPLLRVVLLQQSAELHELILSLPTLCGD